MVSGSRTDEVQWLEYRCSRQRVKDGQGAVSRQCFNFHSVLQHFVLMTG